MSLRKKAIRGIFWSTLQNWAGGVISALVFVLLARLLAPDDFGLLAMAGVYTVLVNVFVEAGISAAVIQRQRLDPEHLDTGFWLNAGQGVALCSVSVAAAPAIAHLFNAPQLTPVVRWLSLSFIVSSGGGIPTALLRRNFGFRPLAIRAVMAAVVGGITAVGMAVAGMGVWSLVAQRLADGLTRTVLVWLACSWRPRLRISAPHARELFAFSRHLIASRLMVFGSRRADQFLIGYFLGAIALGYYYIGYRVVRLIVEMLARSVSSVLLPTFSRLQHDTGRMRAAYYASVRLAGIVTVPAFLGLAVLAPEVTAVAFGPKWSDSSSVMSILALAGVLQGISFMNAPTIAAAGKPSWSVWLNGLDGIVNVVAIVIAVQQGTITAVASAYTIRAYLIFPVRLLAARRLLGISLRTYFRQLLPTLVASGVMLGAVFVASRLAMAGQPSWLVLSGCLLLACVVFFGTLSAIDFGFVRDLLEVSKSVLPGRSASRAATSSQATVPSPDELSPR